VLLLAATTDAGGAPLICERETCAAAIPYRGLTKGLGKFQTMASGSIG
jgi:hypothetical protein